ncbi:acetoin utilization protein AcuC [Gordonia caeni]|uniref:Acetoin utilization protein AcuC n=1 Tax=Gordonia caeni TaxID=1007097 RepID=A0ABP7NM26_9ACTN
MPQPSTGLADEPGAVVWSPQFLEYAWSPYHPMNPVRLDLTMRLARSLGLLDRVDVVVPEQAEEAHLLRAHTPEFLRAVQNAQPSMDDEAAADFGLGGDDNPIFENMHEAAAMIVGGTLRAAQAIAAGDARRAVSIGGGMHHAMREHAAGFCLYNDIVVSISWLLENGFDRIAYIDVDVHHGDGVERAFREDPRVLTVSVHQDPETLWPCTGYSSDVGAGRGVGSVVNLPLPPGTDDAQWLRAFHAVVPQVVTAFEPDIIVSQCGVDTHLEDPLGEFALTVEGQQAAFLAMRALADQCAQGRWLAVGGGGYDLIRVVPRAWTHLLAVALGATVDMATELPESWRAHAAALAADVELPTAMGDGGDVRYTPWRSVNEAAQGPGADDRLSRVDAAIADTRRAVFPLLSLDPDGPDD